METTSLVSLLCSLPALLLEVFVGVIRFLSLPKEILSFNSNLKKKIENRNRERTGSQLNKETRTSIIFIV